MTSFDSLCNENITIRHKDGRTSGPLKASYGDGRFTVFDGTLDVAIGDHIERTLPNNKVERHNITDVEFTQQFHTIPATVRMTTLRSGMQHKETIGTVINNYSVSNSQGVQIGSQNNQQIAGSLKQVLEMIDASNASEGEKQEAKGRLKAFLEHPLVANVVGATVAGLLAKP